jgi:hypothetical protein
MGRISSKKNIKIDDLDTSPACSSIDDLYTPPARATIARVLGDWLTRNKLTVTELLHSAQALQRLDSQGTAMQHAIQKIAVAHAVGRAKPVTQLIRDLDELCANAIRRVYKDETDGVFERKPDRFGAFAEQLSGSPDGDYRLKGMLAKHIGSASSWDAKLALLLGLADELPADGEPGARQLTAIDEMVAEMLTNAAALAELLGPNPDLGHALLSLCALFLGADSEGRSPAANRLAGFFQSDMLTRARAAVAARILSELKNMKRLCPSSWVAELTMLRRLSDTLVEACGKYLSHEDLIEIFAARSRRIVAHEPLFQLVQDARSADEKIERLLAVEENIIGAENKRELATFILPLIGCRAFEEQLAGGVLAKLKRLVELQGRVLQSRFQEVQKHQLAAALDSVAKGIEERAHLLASLQTRIKEPVERAQALLKLCHTGAITHGELQEKVRRLMVATLSTRGFFTAYSARQQKERNAALDRSAALDALAAELRPLDISREEAVRAFAA